MIEKEKQLMNIELLCRASGRRLVLIQICNCKYYISFYPNTSLAYFIKRLAYLHNFKSLNKNSLMRSFKVKCFGNDCYSWQNIVDEALFEEAKKEGILKSIFEFYLLHAILHHYHYRCKF